MKQKLIFTRTKIINACILLFLCLSFSHMSYAVGTKVKPVQTSSFNIKSLVVDSIKTEFEKEAIEDQSKEKEKEKEKKVHKPNLYAGHLFMVLSGVFYFSVDDERDERHELIGPQINLIFRVMTFCSFVMSGVLYLIAIWDWL